MNSAGLLDRCDDLLNPIAVKELRQAVKSRIIMSALMLFLLIQLSILLLTQWFSDRRALDPEAFQAGRNVFVILQGFLLGTCMLLVPVYAGLRLAAEHSDTNVDLLFISTLRPRGIIAGKLQASVVLILLIFAACAPFMTFTYLLRGIDIPSIVLVISLDFLVVLLATQASIFLGAVPANTILKLLLGIVGLAMLGTLFTATMAYSYEMIVFGIGSSLDTVENWLIAGAVAVAIVALIGLFFTWSVAIVSPSSSNRVMPVRLYLLGFWLVTGGVIALLTYRFHISWPMSLWMCTLTVLLCIQIVISINERDHWGFRVARTIPRRAWLRGPIFLLFSSSAGGILFSVLMLVLTIALPNIALENSSITSSSLLGSLEREFHRRCTIFAALIALYTFDYCMLAVWLRQAFFAKWIKPGSTWVLALVLCGLGLALPYPILFMIETDGMGRVYTSPWFEVTNPFPTILTCISGHQADAQGFYYPFLMFLGGWALLVLVVCMPWMARQIGRFHPPEQKETLAT